MDYEAMYLTAIEEYNALSAKLNARNAQHDELRIVYYALRSKYEALHAENGRLQHAIPIYVTPKTV